MQNAVRVLVVCKDLFFTTRIRETAKLTGTSVEFARSEAELAQKLAADSPECLILDLTTRTWDYDSIFTTLKSNAAQLSILGFTTHVLAKTTQPYHGRCTRVVTKETFTQELPNLLTNGFC